jgi:uncharacterized membrane protein
MTIGTLKRILALSAITGMRSMAGAATLAAQHGGMLKAATAMLAAGEMMADKTPFVGNRTDAMPQAGRAAMGALVGGFVATEDGQSAWLGMLVGAGVAVVATHVACYLRTRLPLSTTASGLVEDALVIGAATLYSTQSRRGEPLRRLRRSQA